MYSSLKYTLLTIVFLLFKETVSVETIRSVQEEKEGVTGTCPIVKTVENFDISEYASAKWYVHQQAEISYLPKDYNYCVSAQYTVREVATTPWGYTVDVLNQSQNKNGYKTKSELCAYQTTASPSKLGVGKCWLAKSSTGPYWVVAYDETEGYALVSGGQPKVPVDPNDLSLGCRTGTGKNNSGLWIMSRSQERDENLITKVRTIASEAGFDVTVLNDVVQTDCDVCKDNEGTFKNKRKKVVDCDWVDDWRLMRCVLFKHECPETCGKC